MIRPLLLVALALSVPLFVANRADAQQVLHRVRPGETLGKICDDYYGTRAYLPVLASINGLARDASVKAGDQLHVPTAWTHIAARPTTLGAVAKRLLGHPRRAQALRELNKLRSNRLRVGQRITIPFPLGHVVRDKETFRDIARHYYGSPTRASLIANYNGLRGPAPPAEQEIIVPLARLRLTPLRLQQLLNERVLGVVAESTGAREALQDANGLLRRGDYWQVPLRLLQAAAQHRLSSEQLAAAFKLLAVAYVALDQHPLAVRAFRAALLHQPSLKLDPVRDSPKVIRAFVDAKTRADSAR